MLLGDIIPESKHKFVLLYKFIGFQTRSSRKKINCKDHKQNQAQDIDHNVIEIIIG